ncbi:MAG: cytochrome c3 family protein [Candidatus Korobacteraceae bacterium]
MKVRKLPALLSGLLATVTICGSAFAQIAPQNPILMQGTTGAVKFDHPSHLKVAGTCSICHHASRPEKPLKAPQEACSDCHTKPPTPPVTTSLQAAFHNPDATAGLCIDCHQKQNDAGKAAPVKCAECHQKGNG